MKPRQFLLVTAVAGALGGAAPAFAGPLGIVSGGAGAIGALGGTLSGAGGNPTMGFGGLLGTAGQFQGTIMPPNAVIDTAPVRHAPGVVNSVRGRAQGALEGASEAAVRRSTSALGGVEGAAAAAAHGEASASASSAAPAASASADVDGSAQTQTRFSY
jgi:hypothetical protein